MTTNKDFWDNTLEHCSKEDKDYIASILCPQIKWERDYAQKQVLSTVLDKISAEIEKAQEDLDGYDPDSLSTFHLRVLQIVEKWKGGKE